ncbi:hypothetical protein GQ42DRAFT_111116, partial [Ramicandelaber brevisporus]
WTKYIDIWSVGCILSELHNGMTLFGSQEDCEHLRLMEITIGDFPRSMVQASRSYRPRLFTAEGYVNYPTGSNSSEAKVLSDRRPLGRIIDPTMSDAMAAFHDLMQGLLQLVPEHRLTADDARGYPFFS